MAETDQIGCIGSTITGAINRSHSAPCTDPKLPVSTRTAEHRTKASVQQNQLGRVERLGSSGVEIAPQNPGHGLVGPGGGSPGAALADDVLFGSESSAKKSAGRPPRLWTMPLRGYSL
jgi:hypothetical protein